MNATALVPVFTGIIQNQTVQLCNARDLHTFLKVGRDFSNWIKDRIAEYEFAEGEDFIMIDPPKLANQKGRGGDRRSKDYHLTLDMGKELGMVERNEKGRQIRRYFIECEHKVLGNEPAAPLALPKPAIKTRDDLSFTQRDAEGRLINWSVKHDDQGYWGDGVEQGMRFFDEVAELAAHSETEAYHAVNFALSGSLDFKRGAGTEFRNNGCGIEDGFAESIARAVIDGLRARKGGQESFDPKGGDKKRGRKALPKPKHSALPCSQMPVQQAMALH